ncbi:XRN1 [Symbiodinium natans]|uniref:XRN1 protein n=1 Tax=Symbiodinium natans TaxID=878477 RepID=A0A812UR06_9DINO|nr:XRN1 [Symbiodinium natans]
MGIPKYHKWLTERYPDAFTEASHENADHVYVDINTLLHDCMRYAASEDGFYQHLFAKLDSLFRIVVPSKTVFLAVDGPASCAKCLTQRQRRRAHAQKDSKNSKGSGKGKGKRGKWGGSDVAPQLSNNMLTPGVPFMTKLADGLEYYAASRMTGNGCLAWCQAVTVSGAQAIGEGEHKIVSQMLRNAACDHASTESHVISSGDADIFLLSLVQSACRRVRVVSDRPDAAGQKRRRGTLQIWNAEVLARYIQAELTRAPKKSPVPEAEATLRRDFALVSLLAGNDYLPELKCSLSSKQLWEQYLSLRRKQFPSASLIQSSLRDGLPLSHQEGGWALSVGEAGAAFSAEPYEHFSFNLQLLSKFMTVAAGGPGVQGSVSGRAAEGVRKYLEGLLWILEMYHHGYCGDFYFVLEKSLHSFASARLIAQFLPSLQSKAAEPLAPPRSEQQPMRPISCAICILPAQNAEQFLCAGAPMLRPMFQVDHALLGPVNAIERSEELRDCKQRVTSLQQEMMSLRAQGLDDKSVKAQLTAAQQQMERIKSRSGGSDIDVVPLWQVDDEVAERCSSHSVPELEFRPDVTLLRDASSEALSLQAPARGMRPAHCKGLAYITGEWPQVTAWDETDEALDEASAEADEALLWTEEAEAETAEAVDAEVDETCEAYETYEALDEDVAEPGEPGDPNEPLASLEESFQVGDAVQAYWPDDDEYLPATITLLHGDGSFQIVWDVDGSQSDVKADYLKFLSASEELVDLEPPAKRARLST